MKSFILLLILMAATGCQREKGSGPGDAAGPVEPSAPPTQGSRAACPPDTEMQGGPERHQEWCQQPDGTLQGRFTIWHKNGTKAAEGDYHQNLKQGTWTYWHPSGQKASSGDYRVGKRHGEWTFWHENGQTAETGSFQNGREHGRWISYDEKGEILSEREYQDGLRLYN